MDYQEILADLKEPYELTQKPSKTNQQHPQAAAIEDIFADLKVDMKACNRKAKKFKSKHCK